MKSGQSRAAVSIRHEQAAEWLVRLQDADMPPGELLKWEAWMKQSVLNQNAFSDVERAARRTQSIRRHLHAVAIPSPQNREADGYDGSGPVAEWLARQAAEQAAPDGDGRAGKFQREARRAAAMARLASLPGKPRWLRYSAAAAAIAAALAVSVPVIRSVISPPEALEQSLSYSTSLSEHRGVTLPDGSRILMGAQSSLSVHFSPQQRIVILEGGEALFTVAGETRRPFTVMAGAGTITTLGTAFNVSREDDRVVVTVTRGTVEIKRTPGGAGRNDWRQESAAAEAILAAGYQVAISATDMKIAKLDDPAAATAWQAGYMQYQSEPLKYVIAGVNRYSPREIIIVGARVEEMLFTGSVFQNQTEDWLHSLEEVFPVEVVEMGDGKLSIRERTQVPETEH